MVAINQAVREVNQDDGEIKFYVKINEEINSQ